VCSSDLWNKITGVNDAWPGICCVFWNNKNYIGDYQNGSIYQLDLNVYTDNGIPIIRKRTAGHIHSDRQRLFFHEFEIYLQRGIGLTSGQGYSPKACLQWSDDGGLNGQTNIGAVLAIREIIKLVYIGID
jgi:hypothetical protein